MAFIRLTRFPDHVDVHLHYRHVVAVSTVDGNTFIRTTATNSEGNGQFRKPSKMCSLCWRRKNGSVCSRLPGPRLPEPFDLCASVQDRSGGRIAASADRLSRGVNCPLDSLGFFFDAREPNVRSVVWATPVLLPIARRCDRNTEPVGKSHLRQSTIYRKLPLRRRPYVGRDRCTRRPRLALVVPGRPQHDRVAGTGVPTCPRSSALRSRAKAPQVPQSD